MMEIIKPGTKINFVNRIKFFTIISSVIIIISLAIVFTRGFNLGIDFAGGSIIQVKFSQPVVLDEVRESVKSAVNNDFVIQNFGEPNEVMIRIVEHKGMGLQELSDTIINRLAESFSDHSLTVQRIEQVGPQVGKELKYKAFMAMFIAALGILIYITLRFKLLYAVGAIIALLHDVIFTLGVYSISGKEFNLTVMAALLTAAGYSLNDTIVVYDRIREKVRNGEVTKSSWKDVVNKSLNETLSRTILTSLLTMFAVVSLFIFGGEALNGFALMMILGIISGTYSSIAIAAMFIYYMMTKKTVK